MLSFLEESLSEKWAVRAFSEGSSALEWAQTSTPDLILSDVLMPGVNGIELLHQIRANPMTRTVPVVLISSRTGEDTLLEAFKARADCYLEKPFSLSHLMARIDCCLELSYLRSRSGLFADDTSASSGLSLQVLAAENARLRESLQSLENNEARLRQAASQIQELESRLASRTAAWEEVVEQFEGFCYTIAHDLRAPLRAMEGFASALLEDYALHMDETGKNYATRIVQAAQRLDILIQDLLSYTRLSRRELGIEPTDCNELFSSILSQFAAEIRAKKATVRIAPSLPRIRCDSFTLHQMFSNLLSNSLKFVAPGVAPDISIWAEERESTIRFYVQDNGIGIAPEHQDRVFGVFERLHNSEEYSGTGIGLAVVRKGATRMGGSVGVESIPGQGSRFWIELPK